MFLFVFPQRSVVFATLLLLPDIIKTYHLGGVNEISQFIYELNQLREEGKKKLSEFNQWKKKSAIKKCTVRQPGKVFMHKNPRSTF